MVGSLSSWRSISAFWTKHGLAFVIESAILELTFQKPLSVLAREKDCTSNAIDSVHFVIKNAYIQHQSVIPSEKLWKEMVNLSEASTDLKKSDMILPSWAVQQRVYYDSIPAPSGSISVLNHIILGFIHIASVKIVEIKVFCNFINRI